jgi:hypothetical protein
MRQMIVVVVHVNVHSDHDLLYVIQIQSALRFVLRLGKRRQKHSSEDCDDRNHHEELNQCKSTGSSMSVKTLRWC